MSRFGCIVLCSVTYHDVYAHRLARSVDTTSDDSLMAFARDFASTLALDESELIDVWFTDRTDDPGEARLNPRTGYRVGSFTVDDEGSSRG